MYNDTSYYASSFFSSSFSALSHKIHPKNFIFENLAPFRSLALLSTLPLIICAHETPTIWTSVPRSTSQYCC